MGKILPLTLMHFSLKRVKTKTGSSQNEIPFLPGTLMVTLYYGELLQKMQKA